MRLTKKLKPPYERVAGEDYVYTSETRLTQLFAKVEQKLGQLEDIEEKHNIKSFDDLDKRLTALEIIKEKDVDVLCLKKTENVTKYNDYQAWSKHLLTNEEYNFLKEVLK